MREEPDGADPAAAQRAASATVERTQLSWLRSGLSVAVVATLLIKHAISASGGWTGVAVGLVVLGAAVAVATLPVGNFLRSDGEPAYGIGAIRATAAVCTGIGLLSLMVLLLPVLG